MMDNDLSRFLQNIDPDSNYFHILNSDSTPSYLSVSEFKEVMEKNSNFTCINFNILSFQKNSDSFLGLFDKPQNLPRVFVLTETWFEPHSVKHIPGYQGYHTVREERRSGGVSVYVADVISSRILSEFSFINSSIEICTVQIIINSSKLNIVGIYRPHSDSIDNFVAYFESILTNHVLNENSTLVMGDFNINLLANDTSTINFSNCMQSHHFLPIILKPTRMPPCSSSAQTLLDHIWFSRLNSYSSGIVLSDTTDHTPSFINIPSLSVERGDKLKISF